MNFTKKFEVNKSSLKKPYVIAAWYSAVKKEWNLKVSKTIQKIFWIFSFIVTNDITGENLCVLCVCVCVCVCVYFLLP